MADLFKHLRDRELRGAHIVVLDTQPKPALPPLPEEYLAVKEAADDVVYFAQSHRALFQVPLGVRIEEAERTLQLANRNRLYGELS